MKKLTIACAVGAIALFTISGCKKKTDSTPVATSMTATINGVAFSGSTSLFAINNGDLEVDGGNLNTQNNVSVQLLDPYIRLKIANYIAGTTGTYSFNTASGSYTGSAEIDSNSVSIDGIIMGTTGTITITSSTSSVISGTFSFNCADSTKVTNGAFTAKLN